MVLEHRFTRPEILTDVGDAVAVAELETLDGMSLELVRPTPTE